MQFAVVACPGCRRVQVIETRSLNVHCRSCGQAFSWTERRRFYHGENPIEARRVAATVGLEVAGAGIEAIAESAAAFERERAVSADDVTRKLQLLAEFGWDDVTQICRLLGFKASAEKLVAGLRAQQRLYEPRPGRFRWVG